MVRKPINVSGSVPRWKISGTMFRRLIGGFDVPKDEIMYVGDDVDADVNGASAAGIQPVWFTYVKDKKPPIPALMSPSETDEPHASVPRVSIWNEFLTLLEISQPGDIPTTRDF